MSTLIACPGCQHQLTLPEDFAGKRVQCPRCQIEFEGGETRAPSMDVDPPMQPAAPTIENQPPPLQTAYATSRLGRAAIYCVRCGAKFPSTEDACPACGCPASDDYDEPRPERRRYRYRDLPPIRGTLPIVGAILLALGVLIFIATLVVTEEVFRGLPPRMRLLLTLIGFGLAGLVELTALVAILVWLYQAWRVISHEDEEYSPGLRVGLLLVPFFNLYWMFHAIPGLSTAIQRELKVLTPTRANGCGWVPGLAACVIMLIPFYGTPIAICIFVAWMLIANNALQRFIRLNNERRADDSRVP